MSYAFHRMASIRARAHRLRRRRLQGPELSTPDSCSPDQRRHPPSQAKSHNSPRTAPAATDASARPSQYRRSPHSFPILHPTFPTLPQFLTLPSLESFLCSVGHPKKPDKTDLSLKIAIPIPSHAPRRRPKVALAPSLARPPP